jgi:hypothetical protein
MSEAFKLPTLTPAQLETVAYYRALNVPANWFVGEPAPNGAVECIAIGEDFLWSLIIEANGECASSEAKIGEDGWSTGIDV